MIIRCRLPRQGAGCLVFFFFFWLIGENCLRFLSSKINLVASLFRIHAQHSSASAGYFGISYVFRTLQQESLRHFYRGLVPDVLNIVPLAWAATKLKAAIK